MKHFILTRLGLAVTEDAWYRDKIDVFTSICLASLKAQLDQDFNWIIAIDSRAPDWFQQQLTQLVRNHPNFHIVGVDIATAGPCVMAGFTWVWHAALRKSEIARLIRTPDEYLITSIIDDDDAWHIETTARIKQHFLGQMASIEAEETKRPYLLCPSNGAIATFKKGYWFFLESRAVDLRIWPFHSMSIFVLSRFRSGITAYSSAHKGWEYFHKVVRFACDQLETEEPMWLYTRHPQVLSPSEDRPVAPVELSEAEAHSFGIEVARLPSTVRMERSITNANQRLIDVYDQSAQALLNAAKD